MKHTIDEYQQYFGKKHEYYIDALKQFGEDQTIPFNVYAYMFGPLWFLYKKLYWSVLIYLLTFFAISIGVSTLVETMNLGYNISSLMVFCSAQGLSILFALLANSIYLFKAEKIISLLKTSNLSAEERNKKIKRKGGSTLVPHLILLIVIILLNHFLSSY